MAITFKFLQAGVGDAILVSVDDKNILIDGGANYRTIDATLKEINNKKQLLNLVVLTHIDQDHIKGLLDLLRKPKERKVIKELWFNSFENDKISILEKKSVNKTSFQQGVSFNKLALTMKEENSDFLYKNYISTEKKGFYLFDGLHVDMLSPTKQKLEELYKNYKKYQGKRLTSGKSEPKDKTIEELSNYKFEKDSSVTNGSSIAFLLTYKKKYKFLLLADAHIDVIVSSLKKMGFNKKKRLKLNFVKLSHHGSKNNLNQDFLDLIETNTFIVSTNGKGNHKHPDIETLSKIIIEHSKKHKSQVTFYFNYEMLAKEKSKISSFCYADKEKYNFSFESLKDNKITFE